MKKLYRYLAYAGALPFVIALLLSLLGCKTLPYLGAVNNVITVYGLVIATFMAGTQWGYGLRINQGAEYAYVLIWSNVITLLLWIGFLVLPLKAMFLLTSAAFIKLLLTDRMLVKNGYIEAAYFSVRWRVTMVVVASLLGLMLYP